MPRIPKRLLALGGLAAGGAAFARKRRAGRAAAPAPAAPTPAPAPAPAAPAPPVAATPEPPKPVVHTDDDFVAAEEAAAAAEARDIGGPRLDDAHGDEAFEAAYEAGGGESEGFEAAEDQLIENATHGDGRAEPIGDAFTPEVEADEATVVDGEADEERVSELDEDDTDRR
ncbi:hypothetical protein DSM104299_01228 [Baekduia alba]|uniref:hypothetical protein n=1 Tax=Baekduia alba TaxID=2997333 RepID=UPI00233FBC90|nr:hypothetical protein [Baekduia alba]WCB92532.1 hypothetical protein DSM104299_01228 [Baekduia alba]